MRPACDICKSAVHILRNAFLVSDTPATFCKRKKTASDLKQLLRMNTSKPRAKLVENHSSKKLLVALFEVLLCFPKEHS